VRLTDYYCKLDPSRICPLKIIVRKLEPVAHADAIAGRPEEISQFIENSPQQLTPPTRGRTRAQENKQLLGAGTEETPIKVEEMAEEPAYPTQEAVRERPNPPAANAAAALGSKEQDPLSLGDIMNGKQGFFVGRLIRIKFGSKDAKDGPMSFLYLGFVDINGDLVRVHLAGRMALKESRDLRKGKVYFVKGMELFHGDKTKGPAQIRLKDKEYKISEILNESIKGQYRHGYYKWEHESEWIDSEMSVDVIGIVEEIEEKITYRNANTYQEQRDVVRLVLRNAFKLTKISFWADHINILRGLELKKRQPILIEDIKKKKAVFLDFTAESNIIVLDDVPDLKEELAELLPPLSEAPDPTNIREYQEVAELEPFSAKIRSLSAKISNINSKWVTYKMCNDCKKKVEKILQVCPECQKNDFVFKYNCPIELTDSTGSLSTVAFDGICDKLFGKFPTMQATTHSNSANYPKLKSNPSWKPSYTVNTR
jgi:RNA polymerase subunit RPABC4/transcription elongation factor Spt4